MRYMIILLLLSGCATGYKKTYQELRHQAQARHDSRITSLNNQANEASFKESDPYFSTSEQWISYYKDCGKDKGCTEFGNKTYSARLKIIYSFANFDQVQTDLAAFPNRVSESVKAIAAKQSVSKLALKCCSELIALEHYLRENHNRGVEQARASTIEKSQKIYEQDIAEINSYESESDREYRAALNSLSNTAYQINTQNKLDQINRKIED